MSAIICRCTCEASVQNTRSVPPFFLFFFHTLPYFSIFAFPPLLSVHFSPLHLLSSPPFLLLRFLLYPLFLFSLFYSFPIHSISFLLFCSSCCFYNCYCFFFMFFSLFHTCFLLFPLLHFSPLLLFPPFLSLPSPPLPPLLLFSLLHLCFFKCRNNSCFSCFFLCVCVTVPNLIETSHVRLWMTRTNREEEISLSVSFLERTQSERV